MPSKLYSVEFVGLEARLIEIEVDTLGGIPCFTIVGLPDAAVKEASERVRSAIKNSDLPFPRSKIVVNLAPADLKKAGPRYDLAIAMGILAMEDEIKERHFKDVIIIGELALDGKVRPVNGVIASVDFAKKMGFKKIMVPAQNAGEAALIQEIEILPAGSVQEAVMHLKKKLCVLPLKKPLQNPIKKTGIDMAEIRGQQVAKRALEIAAAGGHNILFCGPPGAGKTLMAQAFAGILPAMQQEEMLEVTKIYSIAGLLTKISPLITERPFRSIHHTASAVSIVGGGNVPSPGEISLAHRGVLFMDELAEFPSCVLDVLRQPMENKSITVSRARGSFTYPAEFALVAAMNPCPCGFFSPQKSNKKACSCTNHQIKTYQKRISGPLLDRMDMYLNIEPVPHREFAKPENGESTVTIRKRVEKAVKIQRKRFGNSKAKLNASMSNKELEQYCVMETGAKEFLIAATEHVGLSARGYHRVLKLARTIADLAEEEKISEQHISEALQYRNRIM